MTDRSSESGTTRDPVLRILGTVCTVALIALTVITVPWGNWGISDDKMLKKRTQAFLAEIQGGLDNYKIDHGTYPINAAVDREAAAEEGAFVLYRELSGDFDLNGELDPGGKIYVESLDFKSSQRQGKGTVGIAAGGTYVAMDPYGTVVRYLCDPPNLIINGEQTIRTLNPTYDLWSLGGAKPGETDLANRSKWITNWGAN